MNKRRRKKALTKLLAGRPLTSNEVKLLGDLVFRVAHAVVTQFNTWWDVAKRITEEAYSMGLITKEHRDRVVTP